MKTTLPILLCLSLLPLAAPAHESAAPAPEVAAPVQAPAPEATSPATNSAAPAPEAALAPKIVCDESTFDFGEKNNTEVIEHDYPIRNTGTLSLEIRDVHASC